VENNTNNTQFKAQPNKNTVYRSRNIKKKKINGGFDFLSDKRFLWNSLNTFISAFLGGIAFAIGTTVFLTVNNKNVGSALFSLGMIIILAYGFGFYTSKIGYSLKNTKEQNILLIPIWIGNLLGALFVSGLLGISETKLIDTFASRANQICSVTLSNSLGGVLVLSIFCGLLMFIATDNYKNAKNAAQKYITLILLSNRISIAANRLLWYYLEVVVLWYGSCGIYSIQFVWNIICPNQIIWKFIYCYSRWRVVWTCSWSKWRNVKTCDICC